MIATQQVRIILDRNQNGLDGRPKVEPGSSLDSGLYWDPIGRKVVPVEAAGPAQQALILLSRHIDITVDDLVRSLAMGGGGDSGRAVPYQAGVAPVQPH